MKFADDLILTADNTEGLKEMLDRLAKYCDKNKSTVNTKKTKIMVFRRGGKLGKKNKWVYKGEPLEVVQEFKYLGFTFGVTGPVENI